MPVGWMPEKIIWLSGGLDGEGAAGGEDGEEAVVGEVETFLAWFLGSQGVEVMSDGRRDAL